MIKGASRISFSYIIIGVLWILVGDNLVLGLDTTFWQHIKGIIYVLMTGSVLWILLHRIEKRNHEHLKSVQLALEEKLEAEKELRDERNLLRTVIDNLPDYIYVKNLQGKSVVVNAKTEKLFGNLKLESREEYNKIIEQCKAKENTVLTSGASIIDQITKFQSADYDVRYILNSTFPLFDSKNEISGIVGMGRDITESYNTSQIDELMSRLVELFSRHKNLEETLSDSLKIICTHFGFQIGEAWLLNQQKDKLKRSGAYVELEGGFHLNADKNVYDLDEGLPGRTFTSAKIVVLNKDESADISKYSNADSKLTTCVGFPLLLENEVLGTFVFYTEKPFGQKQVLKRILDQIALQYIFHLEFKIHEVEIEEANAEMIMLLETINDGYFSVRADWVVNYWNAKTEKMLKIERSQILGKPITDIFPTESAQTLLNYYRRAMEDRKHVRFEHYSEQSDIWFEINIYPAKNGLSIFLRDITENKLLHRELNDRIDGLATSNTELEQFAYIASHDMQEPLRMITGFLGQVEKKYSGILDDKGRQYIKFAVDGAARMRTLILDLLEYSRVGKNDFHAEQFSVSQLIDDVIVLNQTLISETGTVFNIEKMPSIRGGKSLIHQLFQNLITNAIKYKKDAQRCEITIGSDETVSHWKFWVSDNGIGINADYSESIFDIFQRLHSKEMYSGTGIGLSICKKIVENHGGRIWVESEEGKGSTFYFTIKK